MQYTAYAFGAPQIVLTYPAHEFLAKRTAISEDATMQLPVYRLHRIPPTFIDVSQAHILDDAQGDRVWLENAPPP